MKITKNKHTDIKASTTSELNGLVLDDAIGYVQNAISSLSAIARKDNNSDVLDSINDLSVVLLDLKSIKGTE